MSINTQFKGKLKRPFLGCYLARAAKDDRTCLIPTLILKTAAVHRRNHVCGVSSQLLRIDSVSHSSSLQALGGRTFRHTCGCAAVRSCAAHPYINDAYFKTFPLPPHKSKASVETRRIERVEYGHVAELYHGAWRRDAPWLSGGANHSNHRTVRPVTV